MQNVKYGAILGDEEQQGTGVCTVDGDRCCRK